MKVTDAMVRVMIHQTFFPLPGESLSQEVYEEHEPHFRRGLEAALGSNVRKINIAPSVADAPAPTDAEFAAALDAMVGLEVVYDRDAGSPFEDSIREQADAARARVEALHADARNAGLRELREWIDANDGGIRGNMNHYDFAMAQTFGRVRDKIDAMLGGDNA